MSFIKIIQESGLVTFLNVQQVREIEVFEDRVQVYTLSNNLTPDTYLGVLSITEVEQIHWQAKKEEPKPSFSSALWQATCISQTFVPYHTIHEEPSAITVGEKIICKENGLYLIDNESKVWEIILDKYKGEDFFDEDFFKFNHAFAYMNLRNESI